MCFIFYSDLNIPFETKLEILVLGHSPSRQERFNRMKSELTHRGKEAQVEEILEKLADALEEATEKMDVADRQLRISMPIAPGVEHRSLNYVSFFTS
jgi:hypothetical protein